MNRISLYGYALLAFSVIVGALVPIAFSLGSAIPVTTLLFYIALTGVVASFIMMMLKGTVSHLKGFLKDKTYLFAIASLALLEYIVEPAGLSYATHFVTADLAAVVFRLWPVLLVLIAPFVIKEKVTRWDILGVMVGFAALAVTMIGGTPISIPSAELPFVAVLLVVAFGDALGNAISKRYNYELMSSIFGYNLIALIVFAPLAFFSGTWQLTVFTPAVLFAILFTGVVFYALFGYTFFECLRIVKTSVFSTVYIAVPFITMLISALFLGVPIQLSYIVIGVGVVFGLAIQRLAPKHAGNFVVSKKQKSEYPAPLYDITSAFVSTKHPEIYKTMKGGGRVLAFYTEGRNSAAISKEQLKSMGGDNCVLFTDKHHSIASDDELEFIRGITGSTENHMLVMGSGNPDEVMEKFTRINALIKNDAGLPVRPQSPL